MRYALEGTVGTQPFRILLHLGYEMPFLFYLFSTRWVTIGSEHQDQSVLGCDQESYQPKLIFPFYKLIILDIFPIVCELKRNLSNCWL